MDVLLRDIKNFLKKLENGQLDIEAGQWELHKDMTNMRKSLEEVRKLKEEVEEMRMCNAEQMGIIKGLESKLESFKNKYKERRRNNCEDECKKNCRMVADCETVHPKGYKKRKSHHVHSEEIIEITPREECDNESEDEESSTVNEREESCSATESESSSGDCNRNSSKGKVTFACHNVDSEMLERYLKDSAKYCDNRAKSAKKCAEEASHSSRYTPVLNEGYRDAWGGFSGRDTCLLSFTSSNISGFVNEFDSAASVIPKRLPCSKFPKKFIFKASAAKCERHKHLKPSNILNQSFKAKDLWKTHDEDEMKPSVTYRCAYCNQGCNSAKSLTNHMRKCRVILRSRCNI